jgi:hypothetical protein
MFKPGSKFIHFTKYGGVNRGEVKSCGESYVVDAKNCVRYSKPHIVTTKNIILELDGSDGMIFKVEKEYTIEESKLMSMGLQKMTEHKLKRVGEYRNGVEL